MASEEPACRSSAPPSWPPPLPPAWTKTPPAWAEDDPVVTATEPLPRSEASPDDTDTEPLPEAAAEPNDTAPLADPAPLVTCTAPPELVSRPLPAATTTAPPAAPSSDEAPAESITPPDPSPADTCTWPPDAGPDAARMSTLPPTLMRMVWGALEFACHGRHDRQMGQWAACRRTRTNLLTLSDPHQRPAQLVHHLHQGLLSPRSTRHGPSSQQ